MGTILCAVGCLAAPLVPVHWMSVASPKHTPVMPIKAVSRLYQRPLGDKTTLLGNRCVRLWPLPQVTCSHQTMVPHPHAATRQWFPIPMQPSMAPQCVPQKPTALAWHLRHHTPSLQIAEIFPKIISAPAGHGRGLPESDRKGGRRQRCRLCLKCGSAAENDTTCQWRFMKCVRR